MGWHAHRLRGLGPRRNGSRHRHRPGFYQYFWWIDVERPGRYYALGNYGQYIYVAPDADAVVVRVGRDWGVDNPTWRNTFRDVADRLVQRP